MNFVSFIEKKKLELVRVADGQKFTAENVSGFTLKTMPELARLILAAEPTPLDILPAELAGAIKEQVLMARGYPPAHRTASIDEDRWAYWNNRFAQQTIVFDAGGRLAVGRDLF